MSAILHLENPGGSFSHLIFPLKNYYLDPFDKCATVWVKPYSLALWLIQTSWEKFLFLDSSFSR